MSTAQTLIMYQKAQECADQRNVLLKVNSQIIEVLKDSQVIISNVDGCELLSRRVKEAITASETARKQIFAVYGS